MAFKALYALLLGFTVELQLDGGICPGLTPDDGWFSGGRLVRIGEAIVLRDACYYGNNRNCPLPDTMIPEIALLLMASPASDWEIWLNLDYTYEEEVKRFDTVQEIVAIHISQIVNEGRWANE